MIEPTIDYNKNSDLLIVYNPRPTPEWIAAMMSIPKRSTQGVYTSWHAPYNNTALDIILSACRGFTLKDGLLARLPADRREKILRAGHEANATKAALKRLDLDSPLPCGDKLYIHQKQAVKRMIERRRILLADDMGLGKTRTALVAAKAWNLPVLVIAPKSLQINWQREAAAVGVEIETHTWGKQPTPPAGDYVVIFDEAHYAQSLKSKRTVAALDLALAAGCRACYPLTGTPIKNGRPANLYPILLMIQHWIAGDKHGFESTYCDAHSEQFTIRKRGKDGLMKRQTINVWKADGAKNLDKLHEHIKDSVIRRTKAECLDLPPKVRILRRVELEGPVEDAYKDRLKQLKDDYKRNIKANLDAPDGGDSELLTLQIMSAYRQAGSHAKTPAALELANEAIEQGQKVVLFTAFKETANAVAAALKCNALTGDVKDRQAMIDSFQNGDDKAFVCTFGAGGVGVTLTAAEVVILIDRVWTPGDTVQAEDRLHRIGQSKKVTVLWLQVDDMDDQIDLLLLSKQERIDLVLKGKRKTMSRTASSHDIAAAVAELVFG